MPERVYPILAMPPDPAMAPASRAPAIGGLVPFSSVDWPGKLCAVVFISGCPWRCHYCHNPALQQRRRVYDWRAIFRFLESRRGLLEGVVFSGGEPLSEPRLPEMIREAKAMGFQLGLHTAGIYPSRFEAVLGQFDWVGFDVKTDEAGYDALTGRPGAFVPMMQCLNLLRASGVAFECRTTWSPTWLDEPRLIALAERLAGLGVREYAVQNYRPAPNETPGGLLTANTQRLLAESFDRFSYR